MRTLLVKYALISALLLALLPLPVALPEEQSASPSLNLFYNYDTKFEPSPGDMAGTERFQLSQDYPSQLPAESLPWANLDFRQASSWKKYLGTILEYCYQGNTDPAVNWKVQKNTTRKWFHAPWLHFGGTGREPLQGMTYELASEPEKLSKNQKENSQNWAVSVYNAMGGFTIGQVWANPNCPNPTKAVFPKGTVAIKLLFTYDPGNKIKYLDGQENLNWKGYIYEKMPEDPRRPDPKQKRAVSNLKLLQVDIAVRDNRSPTNWVFGTYVYNAQAQQSPFANCSPTNSPWCKVVPIGLAWGQQANERHFNDSRELPEELLATTHEKINFGFEGRLNGPVDNRNSSCLSCHATASWPQFDRVPPEDLDSEQKKHWFENYKATEARTPFWKGTETLDYSLQLSSGIRNFYQARDGKGCLKNQALPFPDNQKDARQIPVLRSP